MLSIFINPTKFSTKLHRNCNFTCLGEQDGEWSIRVGLISPIAWKDFYQISSYTFPCLQLCISPVTLLDPKKSLNFQNTEALSEDPSADLSSKSK